MRPGDRVRVDLVDLAMPWLGRIAFVKFADEPEPVKVRVTKIGGAEAEVVVVPEDVKE